MRRTLRLFVTPAPGRLRNTLMLVAGVLVVLVIWETLRVPNASLACYVILFVSSEERTTTIITAILAAVAAMVAVCIAILINMVGLSEPAVRIILMAVMTFGTMFLYHAAKLGAALFAAGFIVVYALTGSDSLLSLSLDSATVTNSSGTGTGTPYIAFDPPDETLVHNLLWLILAVAVPALVVVLINKAFGRDPAKLLENGLRLRLRAAEAWCDGQPGAGQRLKAIGRRGSPELLKLIDLSEKAHGGDAEPAKANKALVYAATRLVLACLAAEQMRDANAGQPGWMADAARRCAALRDGKDDPGGQADRDPFGAEVQRALDAFARARQAKSEPQPPEKKPEKKKQSGFWKEDAFSLGNVQFALKITLSVMTCYVLNNALDWQGIDTSVVTCFFVALGTLGESGHKMLLRISGCLVGAAMGIGAIILLMPSMTSILDLLLLLAPTTFVAAWIACGSERISYAGWQIALALYETVLQGFGPVTDMVSAKDRIIGILLGNVVSYVVLAAIWPVPVQQLVAGSLAEALGKLARLLRQPGSRTEVDEIRVQFSEAVVKAQSLMRDELYEGVRPGEVAMNEELAGQVQALVVPVAMLAYGRNHDKAGGGNEDVASWLDGVADRLRHGRIRRDAFQAPPARLEAEGPSQPAWALLERELQELPFGVPPGSAAR